jgi:hypothetical protein
LQPSLVAKLRTEPPAYHGEANLLLRRAEREPDQRLVGPETRTFGVNGRKVVSVTQEKDLLRVTLIERRPSFASDNGGQVIGMIVVSAQNPAGFWLVDRAGGRASRATSVRSEAVRASTVEVRRTVLSFPTHVAANEWLTQPEGLEGAVLAKVSYRDAERLTRVAETAQVELKP